MDIYCARINKSYNLSLDNFKKITNRLWNIILSYIIKHIFFVSNLYNFLVLCSHVTLICEKDKELVSKFEISI